MMKNIAVLGGGESGVGAAVLAKVKGMNVWLSDMGEIAQKYKDKLNEYKIDWEEGHHTVEKILAADEIIKSPGVSSHRAHYTQGQIQEYTYYI
jgi:UDP-N-acetylmuramoylalanine--D-glutamate ligase